MMDHEIAVVTENVFFFTNDFLLIGAYSSTEFTAECDIEMDNFLLFLDFSPGEDKRLPKLRDRFPFVNNLKQLVLIFERETQFTLFWIEKIFLLLRPNALAKHLQLRLR